MGRVSRELLRIAQERLIMCERELDNIEPSAPDWLRQDLERRLQEARRGLAFKRERVRLEDGMG